MKKTRPQRTNIKGFHLQEGPRVAKFILETESRKGDYKRLERGGNEELEFNGCRVLAGVDENILEMDDDDGYTAV